MKVKYIYLLLAILGIVLPYSQFIPYYQENGFDIFKFFSDATPNYAASFLAADLTVTAITAIIYILYDSRKNKINNWWISILGIFLVGVSFGFPFYLFLKESKK